MNLERKTAIVTGAGKGIGRVTAQLLVERGARVVGLTRNAEDVASLQQLGCRAIQVDLADARATKQAATEAGPADFLVNCAGTTELQSFLDTTVEAFDHLVAVNTRAPMIVAQKFARSLINEGRGGAIVNVSSVASFVGIPDHAAYCASKGGLDGLTRVMATELALHGIRTNGVHPTVTMTPMAVKAWSDPKKARGMRDRIPVGRFAEPVEIAEVILFLLSDEAAMVNDISMPVDGGYMIA